MDSDTILARIILILARIIIFVLQKFQEKVVNKISLKFTEVRKYGRENEFQKLKRISVSNFVFKIRFFHGLDPFLLYLELVLVVAPCSCYVRSGAVQKHWINAHDEHIDQKCIEK